MKRLFTFLLILPSAMLFAQDTRQVLFLGNSYTGVNNLPSLIAQVAESAGDTLIFDSNTPGGYTLQAHSGNSSSLNRIAQGGWDFVVLQEQSQRPSFPINQVEQEVFPYAVLLDSAIRHHNPCGETMFYMTWGRENGDASNCANWPPVCTYEGMDSLLYLRYMMMTDSNDAVVSPVGAVWHYIREHYPDIDLYSTDGSHPSGAGSYAAACAFYTAIFRKSPLLINTDYTLDATIAADIRNAAKTVVYDSLSKWFIGAYDVSAGFSYSIVSGFEYQFHNLSANATNWQWTIDGNYFTTKNPIYTFSSSGIYEVELMATNNCDTAFVSDSVIVDPVGINQQGVKEAGIFPNPAGDYLEVTGLSKLPVCAEIFDVKGNLLYSSEIGRHGEKIKMSHLKNGVYILRLSSEEGKREFRFVKSQ